MIHFFGDGMEASNDVSEAFAVGQLGKSHDTKVVGAFESLDVVVAAIPVNTGLKASPRNALHNLGKDEFSLVHRPVGASNFPEVGKSN